MSERTWNRVEDGLPDRNLPVDIFVVGPGFSFRAPDFCWSGTDWVNEDGAPLHWVYANASMVVTHWMHRPASPDEIADD